MDVDPDALLFTQDSIKNTFKEPRENERIDDAVDSLLKGKIKASDFPSLNVVQYDDHLWSLDNRRLWVFKKAGVRKIRVKLVNRSKPRFRELMGNPCLMGQILQRGYWPRVRGVCRQSFHPRVERSYLLPPNFPPCDSYVRGWELVTERSRLHTVANVTPQAWVLAKRGEIEVSKRQVVAVDGKAESGSGAIRQQTTPDKIVHARGRKDSNPSRDADRKCPRDVCINIDVDPDPNSTCDGWNSNQNEFSTRVVFSSPIMKKKAVVPLHTVMDIDLESDKALPVAISEEGVTVCRVEKEKCLVGDAEEHPTSGRDHGDANMFCHVMEFSQVFSTGSYILGHSCHIPIGEKGNKLVRGTSNWTRVFLLSKSCCTYKILVLLLKIYFERNFCI